MIARPMRIRPTDGFSSNGQHAGLELVRRQDASLFLTKLVRGDAYRLTLTLGESMGATHVRAVLKVSSD